MLVYEKIFFLLLVLCLFLLLKDIECVRPDRGAVRFPLLAKSHENIRVPVEPQGSQKYDFSKEEDEKHDPCKSVKETNKDKDEDDFSKSYVENALRKRPKSSKKGKKFNSKDQYVTDPKCDTHEEPPKQILHINPQIFNKTISMTQKSKPVKKLPIQVPQQQKIDFVNNSPIQAKTFDYRISHVPHGFPNHHGSVNHQPVIYHPHSHVHTHQPTPQIHPVSLYQSFPPKPKIQPAHPPIQLHTFTQHAHNFHPTPVQQHYVPKYHTSYVNPTHYESNSQTLTHFPKFLYKSEVFYPPYSNSFHTQYSTTHPHPSEVNKHVEPPKVEEAKVEEEEDDDEDEENEGEVGKDNGSEEESEEQQSHDDEEEEDEESNESGSEKSSSDSDNSSNSKSSSSSSPSNSYNSFSSYSSSSDHPSDDSSRYSEFDSDFFTNYNTDSDGKSSNKNSGHSEESHDDDDTNSNEEYNREYSYESSETKDAPKRIVYHEKASVKPKVRPLRKPRTKQNGNSAENQKAKVSQNIQQLRNSSKSAALKLDEPRNNNNNNNNDDVKYFQYFNYLGDGKHTAGNKQGNNKHYIEQHELGDGKRGTFQKKVRWADKMGGFGEHFWDLNHG